MTVPVNTLRDLWDRGEPTLGGWLAIPDSFAAEVVGQVGFDWVAIDMQHGLVGYSDMRHMLQGLSTTNTPAFVRTPWNDPSQIMKALDAGAQGVIVPMVNSPEEAAMASQACRYPPRGIRSWGPTRVSMVLPNYVPPTANDLVICAVMIETVDAVNRIEEILDVPGVDAVFIGPNDLGVSAGFPPTSEPVETEHVQLIETILKACQRRGIVAGIACGTPALTRRWRDLGFQMLAGPSEASLMREAAETFRREAGWDGAQRTRPRDGYT